MKYLTYLFIPLFFFLGIFSGVRLFSSKKKAEKMSYCYSNKKTIKTFEDVDYLRKIKEVDYVPITAPVTKEEGCSQEKESEAEMVETGGLRFFLNMLKSKEKEGDQWSQAEKMLDKINDAPEEYFSELKEIDASLSYEKEEDLVTRQHLIQLVGEMDVSKEEKVDFLKDKINLSLDQSIINNEINMGDEKLILVISSLQVLSDDLDEEEFAPILKERLEALPHAKLKDYLQDLFD